MASRVQFAAANNSTGTSSALAYGSNVTAGNLLVSGITGSNLRTVTSTTDTLGNTWNLVIAHGTTAIAEIWWTVSGSSGANTVTMNFSGSVTSPQQSLWEASGSGTWATDVSSSILNSGVTSHPCASGTGVNTTGTDAFGVTHSGVGSTFAVNAGAADWTQETHTSFGMYQYRVFAATVSNETATWTSAASETTIGMIAVFKLDGGAANPVRVKRRMLLGVGL